MTQTRKVLLVTHTRRPDAVSACQEALELLKQAGIVPVVPADEMQELKAAAVDLAGVQTLGVEGHAEELELAMVLGGDGTILRAAEVVRDAQTPVLGINLGHVGFLAESERGDLVETVKRIAARDYVVSDRLTIEVSVIQEGQVVFRSWALNESTVERAAAGRLLEIALEVDGRPLSTFGCDGIVLSTPTGSTAHAFSAGGPVVWPSVEALTVVPLSAHALFSRPLVVGPDSKLAVEILSRSTGHGVLWCDGRRSFDLAPGARVEVRRSDKPVRLARLEQGSFTDRIVRKFGLPVAGWRGPEDANQ